MRDGPPMNHETLIRFSCRKPERRFNCLSSCEPRPFDRLMNLQTHFHRNRVNIRSTARLDCGYCTSSPNERSDKLLVVLLLHTNSLGAGCQGPSTKDLGYMNRSPSLPSSHPVEMERLFHFSILPIIPLASTASPSSGTSLQRARCPPVPGQHPAGSRRPVHAAEGKS